MSGYEHPATVPDQVGIPQVVGFLSLSTPDTGHQNQAVSLSTHLMRAARLAAARSAEPWSVGFIRGSDIGVASSAEIRKWVRSQLVCRASFHVTLLLQRSYGCGREESMATELGLPSVVAVPEHEHASPLIGGIPAEGPVDLIVFRDHADLIKQWGTWVRDNRDRVLSHDAHRFAPLAETEPRRVACANSWKALSSEDRDNVAWRVGMDRADVRDLLASPLEFAWAGRDVLRRLTDVLGIRRPEATAEIQATLPLTDDPELLEAYHRAVDEYGGLYRLDPHTGVQVLIAGLREEEHSRRLEARGQKLRRPGALTNFTSWKRIMEQVCGPARR